MSKVGKKRSSKKNLLNHSEAKVRLLGVYINKYLNIISNDGYSQKIRIYDLFCGEGVYDNGGYGSPVVLMKAVKDCYYSFLSRSKRIPKIDVLLNDLDESKVAKTKNFLTEKSLLNSDIAKVDFKSEDYKDLLKVTAKELASIKQEKAFVFIDPYEYKHIKVSHIKELMKNKKTEVLLWLPTQFMYRFETNGTPTALKDFIEEIVPYKDWNKSDNVWSFINQLREGFQSKLTELYVDTFTIQKDSSTVFCLFFFTSHIKGFEKMLEAKWDIDAEAGKGWHYSPQLGLFAGQETNKLAVELEEFMGSKERSNAEIFEFVLRLGFLPKHANEVFDSWQVDSKLEVILANGTRARKKSFYLNYKNYRDDPDKVSFKLK